MAPPNSSGKDERLPASLFTVYQTYKRGTSIVIGWLIAADTGSPKDHRTTDNAASTDTVTVKQLLESAQKASHEKRVPPNTVHDAFKIVLVNHTRLTRYYESLSSISSETKASTVCHKVFNETLAQAYNILFAKPKTSKRSQKKKISTASEANPPISSNSFEALSAVIEQEVDFELTASQFWDSEITQTTEPPTILNDTIADAVAMHTFVGELQTFVTKIKEIWKSAASGELPLAVAGWLTNVGHRYLLLWEEYSPQHSNLWKDQTGWSLVSQGRWIGPDEDFIWSVNVPELARLGKTDEFLEFTHGHGLAWARSKIEQFRIELRDDNSSLTCTKLTEFFKFEVYFTRLSEEHALQQEFADATCHRLASKKKMNSKEHIAILNEIIHKRYQADNLRDRSIFRSIHHHPL
ncbi:hypothetical protein A1F94_008354 [Pyrenophora tritici-repentis]|uniref:Uncharacterized protein n=2 Tax=Pyrenophora tritici-repentis TaxID=45151 RepID=A0A5M9LGL3_9PLEO|nr:uncharacterized protein PTRG_10080 [Pyrenophora tritici-repentis Pt-1C-BFP]KAA8621509.1 hypothetical protein PtrV1_06010 [Pyrenophora tritici-repentis]EDU43131.1 predicted protein [Pyrenophora tritici-repentis Pt-1C-BFP]KAF7450751.1 hypothetical protein A1F99_053670 [Pyrenophora tritici-repentis]KAF7573398.1 hypothetical protein PtrM4_083030 [Pyrenophora tritici-repentis]KAG9381034.1 hypothetical protein A1F94_008354 [Pyrenophora tritici-repentis]